MYLLLQVFKMLVTLVLLAFTPSCMEAMFLQQDYYTEAKFYCDTTGTGNKTLRNNLEVSRRYWLLADGSLINRNSKLKNRLKLDTNFTLSISRITDEDFGLYYCIFVFNDSSLLVQRHELNVDGATFNSLKESYGKRAIFGSIAAVSLLGFMLGAYIIYRLQFSKKARRRKMIAEDLKKGMNRFSTAFYDNIAFEAYTKRSSFKKTSQNMSGDHVSTKSKHQLETQP